MNSVSLALINSILPLIGNNSIKDWDAYPVLPVNRNSAVSGVQYE
ncbi:MAG: hypothetical protein NTX36_06830 [Proteobacteria bacterium]|nr:hypothetical protein [Pseudomonadota bacterium]